MFLVLEGVDRDLQDVFMLPSWVTGIHRGF